jgi:hypothetical protein
MKVSFGAGVADGRGSIGGVTFSRNRYGSYARKRVVPVNPNTTAQIRARSDFQTAATSWRALTDADRAAWTNYAAATPIIDRLGATVYLTGMQAYMSVTGIYRSLNTAAGSTLVTLPHAPTVASGIQHDDLGVITITAKYADDEFTLTIPGNTATGGITSSTAGEYAALFLSRPVSPQINFFKGPWIITGAAFHSGAEPVDEIPLNRAFLATLGIAPTVGSKMFAKLVRFSTVNTRIPVIRTQSVVWAA